MLEASLCKVIVNSTLFEIIDPRIKEHADSTGGERPAHQHGLGKRHGLTLI